MIPIFLELKLHNLIFINKLTNNKMLKQNIWIFLSNITFK